MGELVVQEFVTADGFAANENNEFTACELIEGGTGELDRSQLAWLDTVDAMVLGAVTYRMFAGFWPTPASDGEIIAPALNGLRRYVFSGRLKSAPWGSMPAATIESGDAVEAIRRIKRETEGAIVLWGSLSLAQALMAAGLIDEYHLQLCPTILGGGRPLFPGLAVPSNLERKGVRTYETGVVYLHYEPRRAGERGEQ